MIINAVIESKDGGTLVLDFPRSIYDVYEMPDIDGEQFYEVDEDEEDEA